MEDLVCRIEEIVWSYPLIMLLLFIHLLYTVILKFPQKNILYGLKSMFKIDKKNEISSFNSLMTVLAAMIGTGNIIGVSSAILVGGVGSIFWIFISGVLAISTKYAETFLCLKYRRSKLNKFTGKINYYGGTMYVLSDRLNNKVLACLFSVFVILASFGIGSMIQSNASSTIIVRNFGFDINAVAIIITTICGIVVFSSAKIISKVSSIIVPISTVVFIVMQVGLIWVFRDNILNAIYLIISDAFTIKAGATGILTSVVVKQISVGLSKGMFSNEAGMGSTPIFECTSSENDIAKQATISSVSVFIDTVCLCTFTGIIFVASKLYLNESSPTDLVSNVFSNIPFGNGLLTFCLVSFAISAIPCWSYYGKVAVKYLFRSDLLVVLYRVLYIVCIYVGCVTHITVVWSISGVANALMVIPNIWVLLKLSHEVPGFTMEKSLE